MDVKTAIYIRVSTEEQVEHGYSIRAQKEKLTYYATIKEWNIVDFYIDEGISGKNISSRLELKRMLKDIKEQKVNNVLVYKIDRLTRSTKDLIDLIEFFNRFHCDFNSLCEAIDTLSATGRMFIKIIGIFAEFERENIIERVKLGLERKVKEGYTIASATISYGYQKRKGQKIQTQNKKEAEIVRFIFLSYLKGMNFSEIARLLNKKQIKTKKNHEWSYKSIKLILMNPNYIGKVRYGIHTAKYFETDGKHEKIIDQKLFDKVKRKLQQQTMKRMENKALEDAYLNALLYDLKNQPLKVKRIYFIDKKKVKHCYIHYKGENFSISQQKIEQKLVRQNLFLEEDDFIEKRKKVKVKLEKIFCDKQKNIIYIPVLDKMKQELKVIISQKKIRIRK